MDFSLIGWWWGKWESHHQSSGFKVCIFWAAKKKKKIKSASSGQHTVSFFHLVGVSVSAKNIAQNLMYRPRTRNKSSWLCLMVQLLSFCFSWLFSFPSAFSYFSDSIYSLAEIFYRQKDSGQHGQESILGGLIGCFFVTPLPFWKKDHNSWSFVKEKWHKLNFQNEEKNCNAKVHAYMWDKARTYWHYSLERQTKPLRLQIILSVVLQIPQALRLIWKKIWLIFKDIDWMFIAELLKRSCVPIQ